jgi:hypothetical protein
MVVTLGALHRERTESRHDCGHHIVTVQMTRYLPIDFTLGNLGMSDEIPWPRSQKSSGLNPVTVMG